jgi:hypothetical protein
MKDLIKRDGDEVRLTQQLRRAVRSETPPPYLEARIRNTIRAGESVRSWTRRLIPAGAAAVICLGVGIAYQLGHLRLTTSSQESYIASVSNRVGTLMRVGLGDHLHCSVFRKFSKEPPKIEELADKIGPEYSGLIPIVREQIPQDLRMVIAHECRYHGRKFVHISARSGSQLLSLIIARKRDGESFVTENVIPALAQSGISFYRAGVQRFEIASFESRDHMVYLVSDFSQRKNMEMLLAMAPQLSAFLSKRES